MVEQGSVDLNAGYLLAMMEAIGNPECGIASSAAELAHFHPAGMDAGYRVLHRHALIEGADPASAASFARIAGFGVLLGRELFVQLDRSGSDTRAVADACGLLHLFISCFDHIVDDQPNASELLLQINRDNLLKAVDRNVPQRVPVFNANCSPDRKIRMTVRIADRLFARCRAWARKNGHIEIWDSFRSCLLEAFDAELTTLTPWHEVASGIRSEHNRSKNVLPSTLMVHIVLLARSAKQRDTVPPSLWQMARLTGEIAGMIDDATDLPEDLRTGDWNQFLFELSRKTRDRQPSLQTVVAANIPALAASRIQNSFQHLLELADRSLPRPERFLAVLRFWYSSWLLELKSPDTGVGAG